MDGDDNKWQRFTIKQYLQKSIWCTSFEHNAVTLKTSEP